MLRKIASLLANGPVFARGRRLYDQNQRNFWLPLSKYDKLQSGVYLVLTDYAKGLFPPTFDDQQAAYAAEIAYRATIPGVTAEKVTEGEMQKPFWFGGFTRKYLQGFLKLMTHLETLQIRPGTKLLELGCGTGWMAEFLAVTGYEVTATSIAEVDIEAGRLRAASLATKGLVRSLRFEATPMESVAQALGLKDHYDAVYVFEALHHAFDWRSALESSRDCLKPGGWLLVCNEPNLVHTFSSYRVARLSNTHEVGFSRRELMTFLRQKGFINVRRSGNPFHFWIAPHWICAQKPA